MLDSATVSIESDAPPQAPAPGPAVGMPSSSDLTFLAAAPAPTVQAQPHPQQAQAHPPATDEDVSTALVDSEEEAIDMGGQGGGGRRKGRRRRKSGVDPVMVLVGMAVLIGLVFVLVKLTEPVTPTVVHQDGGDPQLRKPKNSFTNADDPKAKPNSNGVASVGPDISSSKPKPPRLSPDPNNDPPDPAPVPEPAPTTPDDQPTGELFPDVNGVKSNKPTRPINGEPPPATVPVNRRDIPELKLTRSTDHAWQPLTATSAAIVESGKIEGVAHWSASMHTVVEGSKTIIMGMIVPDSQQVWRSADVHVQIYGDKGLLSGTTTEVPFIVGRQETVVRLQVPQNLATQTTRVVATVKPRSKVLGALHLEHDESFLRIMDENSKPLAMEARLYNPHDKVIRDPEVVVEAVGEDGWPIGIYQGKLTGAVIEPGKGYEFYMAVPIQIKLPGQISIRAFGLEGKATAGN